MQIDHLCLLEIPRSRLKICGKVFQEATGFTCPLLVSLMSHIDFLVLVLRKGGLQKRYWGFPPQVDQLDVVGRLTPSMNGNQEFTTLRSLMSQLESSHWDMCSC
jgi:hypothetical protein